MTNWQLIYHHLLQIVLIQLINLVQIVIDKLINLFRIVSIQLIHHHLLKSSCCLRSDFFLSRQGLLTLLISQSTIYSDRDLKKIPRIKLFKKLGQMQAMPKLRDFEEPGVDEPLELVLLRSGKASDELLRLAKSLRAELHVHTCRDLLHRVSSTLAQSETAKSFSWQCIDALVQLASTLVSGGAYVGSARRMAVKEEYISTGCRNLDAVLGGSGYRCGELIEIAGESGSGKTQLCLQALVSVQLDASDGGVGAGALLLATSANVPMQRLRQMCAGARARVDGDAYDDHNFGERICIEIVPTLEALWESLNLRVPLLLARQSIRLIVLDSLAALVRFEYAAADAAKRAVALFKIAALLKRFAVDYRLPVLLTNQVSDRFGAEEGEDRRRRCDDLSAGIDAIGTKQPALGLAWSNCINTRLFLHRSSSSLLSQPLKRQRIDSSSSSSSSSIARHLEIMLSSKVALQKVAMQINTNGVSIDD
jgi:DNA-repair protein XRCC3